MQKELLAKLIKYLEESEINFIFINKEFLADILKWKKLELSSILGGSGSIFDTFYKEYQISEAERDLVYTDIPESEAELVKKDFFKTRLEENIKIWNDRREEATASTVSFFSQLRKLLFEISKIHEANKILAKLENISQLEAQKKELIEIFKVLADNEDILAQESKIKEEKIKQLEESIIQLQEQLNTAQINNQNSVNELKEQLKTQQDLWAEKIQEKTTAEQHSKAAREKLEAKIKLLEENLSSAQTEKVDLQKLLDLAREQLNLLKNNLAHYQKVNWRAHGVPFLAFDQQITQQWISAGFNKYEAQDWLNIGLSAQDYKFCAYLRDELNIDSELILNHTSEHDLTNLRTSFAEFIASPASAPGINYWSIAYWILGIIIIYGGFSWIRSKFKD